MNPFAVFLWREKQILTQLSLPMSRWMGGGPRELQFSRNTRTNVGGQSLISNLSFHYLNPQEDSEAAIRSVPFSLKCKIRPFWCLTLAEWVWIQVDGSKNGKHFISHSF